jgi:hypothetical protein
MLPVLDSPFAVGALHACDATHLGRLYLALSDLVAFHNFIVESCSSG